MEIENIVWPENITPEQKEWFRSHIERVAYEKTLLCVIYHPNCGCSVDQFVRLDRCPMSPKIMSICPVCSKGCLMEISDPIIFHLPLTSKDYTLEDLKTLQINEGPQKHLIEKYKDYVNQPKSTIFNLYKV